MKRFFSISSIIAIALTAGLTATASACEFGNACIPSDASSAIGGGELQMIGGGVGGGMSAYDGGTVQDRYAIGESTTVSDGLISFNANSCEGCPENASIIKGSVSNLSIGAAGISTSGSNAAHVQAQSQAGTVLKGFGYSWSTIKPVQ